MRSTDLTRYRSSVRLPFGRAWGALSVVFLLQGSMVSSDPLVRAPQNDAVMPVPAELQLITILNALIYDLNFDRNFRNGTQSQLKIGIVYAPGDPGSVKAKDQISEVLNRYEIEMKTVNKVPIKHYSLEYSSESQFESITNDNPMNLYYIAPGIRDNLDNVLKISRDRRILTVTGVPDYVRRGVAVGVDAKHDRAHILIDNQSAKSAGTQFDAGLLWLPNVTVVRR